MAAVADAVAMTVGVVSCVGMVTVFVVVAAVAIVVVALMRWLSRR